jgi:hypothetical protein
MRHLTSILLLLSCFQQVVYGQKEIVVEKGVTSYVSAQNVYVKFTTTELIKKGDTLFSQSNDAWMPALLVKDKSSTSCVCSVLRTEKPKVGDVFFARVLVDKKPEKAKDHQDGGVVVAEDGNNKPSPVVIAPTSEDKDEQQPAYKQKIKGRLSAASYSNINGADVVHRMRYTLTFQGNNLKNSRFSTDNYISFRHTVGEWSAVKGHLGDALKVYALSVKYDVDKTSSVTLGRKINNRISSMGAIDGLQYEKGLGNTSFGVIGGWRPDYTDYGFNSHLFQVGAYFGYSTGKSNKNEASTLAFVEQRNQSKTDRRFVYFQHTNTLLKNLNMFSSFEVDLYQYINNEITHTPSLTNLLVSLRYRVSKKINLSLSYDNRKNIVYYESYKNYIDQLIDDETRQGLRFGGSYRLSKIISWGFNASWRFQKSDINVSKNINTYLNFSRLPVLNATASISANLLQTNYLDSKIYGARVSKELIRGKLQSEVYFRMVDYRYKNYEYKIQQQIAGIDLSWYITHKLALYLYYEGTFDKSNDAFNRINAKVIQRF